MPRMAWWAAKHTQGSPPSFLPLSNMSYIA
jgi:hypothetical protein